MQEKFYTMRQNDKDEKSAAENDYIRVINYNKNDFAEEFKKSTNRLISKIEDNLKKEIKRNFSGNRGLDNLRFKISFIKKDKKEILSKIKNGHYWNERKNKLLQKFKKLFQSDNPKDEELEVWFNDRIEHKYKQRLDEKVTVLTEQLLNQTENDLNEEIRLRNKDYKRCKEIVQTLTNENKFIKEHQNSKLKDISDIYKRTLKEKCLDDIFESINQIVKDLKKQFKKDNPTEVEIWYKAQIEILLHKYTKELEKTKDEIDKNLRGIIPPIVWGMPEIIMDSYNRENDAFIHTGSTKEKTVYIPFREVHKQLLMSNLKMRGGEDYRSNTLLAHLFFVISDRIHKQDGNGKYIGGRKFIDLPIVIPTEEIGTFTEIAPTEHSEIALKKFLENDENIKNIVSDIARKIENFLGNKNYQDFKIYGLCLFINSQRNICGGITFQESTNSGANLVSPYLSGCERKLKDLMTSHEEGSFLSKLKNECEKQGFKTPYKSNNKFPYVFISVSAHQVGECGSNRLIDDAICLQEPEIGSQECPERATSYTKEYINIKALAGKIILSTAEKWIDKVKHQEREQYIKGLIKENKVRRPFYMGFISGKEKCGYFRDKNTQLDEVKYFDGINILDNSRDETESQMLIDDQNKKRKFVER